MSRPSSARGLRREAAILLPASLLLFAMLASVTLLSYRAAVARFAAEREQATLKLAGALVDALRLAKSDDVGVLARWLPSGAALAIYDARGVLRSSLGGESAEPFATEAPRAADFAAPRVEGLDWPTAPNAPIAPNTPNGEERMRAFVPYERAAQRLLLRLDVPEPTLLAQQRSLRILTPVVFGLSFAVALLAIFFLRALVRPYEELLDKARAVADESPAAAGAISNRGSDSEVERLLATFDRALAALRNESGQSERGRSDSGRSESGSSATGRGAGAALDELAAVQRTLGPQLESGLLMFDRAGCLLAANPAAVELLGVDSLVVKEASPRTAAAALAAHPELAAVVSSAIAAGRSIPRASVSVQRDGHRVELGLTLQALRPDGERSGTGGGGFLVLFADVTDLSRRESEERFAAGLAQLGELSAGVAHELRNSLATVQGYLALAARRELPAAAREEVDEARREAGELARIVDDFLTFARPGSGVVEPVDLAALLARATSDPALGSVPFELVPADEPLPPIAGDPHLLQRALRNLLLNAAQATLARAAADGATGAIGAREAAPEPVVVRLRRDAAAAIVTIDDHGTGLAPEIRDRLFEPFASGRPGGAGLGLALARRIVLMHGGSLELRPREPFGMRAEIRLPLGQSVT